MKTVVVLLAVVVLAGGCERPDPADTPECREWNKLVLVVRAAMENDSLADAMVIEKRPEGCPIPG